MLDGISAKLPKRIEGLKPLAYNLWWSWTPEAREIFKVLDRSLWNETQHNPVRMLQLLPKDRLEALARHPEFLGKYDTVMAKLGQEIQSPEKWCNDNHPTLAEESIAYFSMEFAVHSSLPIYAGGLGVLAGDYCKEASDLGLPLVGVGFMYPQGYFKQSLDNNAWQQEMYIQLDFRQAPLTRVTDIDQRPLQVTVPLDSRSIEVAIWQVNIGRVKLYLLDSDLEDNSAEDRMLTARLYNGGPEMRLKQEILLGIGGVRALRALKLQPNVWHANEGHTTFMMVERCRELVEQGMKFNTAAEKVRASTIFTTHTPVPAGNDAFPADMIERYFHHYRESLDLTPEQFLNLARLGPNDSHFNMTVLGLRMADFRNGVSQLHGSVCRHMWQAVWPVVKEEEIPICSITNGIHVPTWVAGEMAKLYEKYVGREWLDEMDNPAIWERINLIPDKELIETRGLLKSKLMRIINDRARQRWNRDWTSLTSTLGMGALLDDRALTIGFSRRFTDYKRATLILRDKERLKSILLNETRPVQLIFAGKAHPNDYRGKQIIQEILQTAFQRGFGGHIGFVEDYDIHIAHYLVQGVDIWLNTPYVTQEACGTSGMKAGVNGVPHLSVLDGWWYEAHDGTNGWTIDGSQNPINSDQNEDDSRALYQLLEEKIIPLYYERDLNGISHGWAKMIKGTIRSTIPNFCARRMAKEYAKLYLAALKEGATPELIESAIKV
jgi:glycogen phosphorylase